MSQYREIQFNADGITLNCIDYGGEGKPPLLFLHGGSAHAHWWDFTAPAFIDDYHSLALDQRGHGESDRPSEWAYGSRHYVADLDRVIDQLGPGKPILIGHSMGGHNALLYASAHSPKLSKLVIIDTLPEYPQEAVDFLRTLAEKAPRRFPSMEDAVANFKLLPRESIAIQEILDHIARHTFRQDPEGYWIHKLDRRTLIREPLCIWEGLKKIACPTLIVKMTKSPLMSHEQAQRMVALLPNSSYAEIDQGYHHVMFDNPGALISILRSFLREPEAEIPPG